MVFYRNSAEGWIACSDILYEGYRKTLCSATSARDTEGFQRISGTWFGMYLRKKAYLGDIFSYASWMLIFCQHDEQNFIMYIFMNFILVEVILRWIIHILWSVCIRRSCGLWSYQTNLWVISINTREHLVSRTVFLDFVCRCFLDMLVFRIYANKLDIVVPQ